MQFRIKNDIANLIFILVLLISVDLCLTKAKTNLKTKQPDQQGVHLTNFEYDLFYVDSECNNHNCPTERGYCQGTTRCVCRLGWANLNRDITYYCDYQQKSQKISFLLELFFPIGIGHFYSGRFLLGFAKLVVICGTVLLDFMVKGIDNAKSRQKNNLIMFVYTLYLFILIWQVFDLVMIGLNKYTDGNGIPLFPS
jgi:hypothetical protein